jgi:hypothetical protein
MARTSEKRSLTVRLAPYGFKAAFVHWTPGHE